MQEQKREMTFDEFRKKKLPFFIATFGELFALMGWLYFFDHKDFLNKYVFSTIALWTGFMIERLTVVWWAKTNFGSGIGVTAAHIPAWKRMANLLLITLSEIIVWMLFVWVFDQYGKTEANGELQLKIAGIVAAVAILFAGEQLQHSYELHIMQRQPWSHYFWQGNTALITFYETLGGFCWLYFNRLGQAGGSFLGLSGEATLAWFGGLLMLVALGVEHVVEGGALAPKLAPDAPPAS
jgi:hypothetical protein